MKSERPAKADVLQGTLVLLVLRTLEALGPLHGYPNLRNIVVYTAHEWRELGGDDKLEFPDLLPGVSVAVSDIFNGI